jgi:deoxyribodipyrimidine photo-lyase
MGSFSARNSHSHFHLVGGRRTRKQNERGVEVVASSFIARITKKLELKGLSLITRRGNSLDELTVIIEQTNADAVFFGERNEPSIISRDSLIRKSLLTNGVEVRSFQSNLLFSPGDLLNQKNEPYKVFTSFWKRTMQETVQRPLPIPVDFVAYDQEISSLQVEELGLLPAIRWDEKFCAYWQPGEESATARWQEFTDEGLSRYVKGRDIPSADSVSH